MSFTRRSCSTASSFQKLTNSKSCLFLEPAYWLTSNIYPSNIFPRLLLTVIRERARWIRRRSTSSWAQPLCRSLPCPTRRDLPSPIQHKNRLLFRIGFRFPCGHLAHHVSISSHLEGSCSPAAPFTISLAAASKHIKVLENAGLIRREVRGRTHWCRFDRGPLANAHQWLSLYERFWTGRLDVLERLLRKEDAHKSTTPKTGEDQ
jgi:DNA-binding transcriptional ArsR family regulator